MIDEKEGEKKTLFGNKFFIIFPAVLVILIILFAVFYFSNSTEVNSFFSCGDGTESGSCSINKPYFCDKEGKLVEKAGFCGCQNPMIPEGDLCFSEYAIEPKNITLEYILDGKKNKINFVVYKGLVNYLSNLPKTIHYDGGEEPTRQDFKLRNINEEEQREFLLPLIVEIQNLANEKEKQAKIAVSLVQEIPYGSSEKSISIGGGPKVEYSRYPYEVLYDGKGVCGEKSELLAFLLKELGFDVSIFYYRFENHEAVGIKCPTEYAVEGTEYCFVETSGVSIISNNQLTYTNGVELLSTPELIPISEGNSLGENLKEYEDTKELLEIEKKIEETGKISFFEDLKLKKIKKKYGLDEEYRI